MVKKARLAVEACDQELKDKARKICCSDSRGGAGDFRRLRAARETFPNPPTTVIQTLFELAKPATQSIISTPSGTSRMTGFIVAPPVAPVGGMLSEGCTSSP
ncbi:hypothetical protein POM88_020378 [Heracleum sosnowskyi]|uniref:Uncharacterized protein n=1 Tax=Heracleum sosnowskyi TaxID=360622 RepID=A0AAD8ICG1_9APIA|nr:hypothetical protein POM88_020370 [Heracleum sosnowskyi]KAK1382639.1 hypothetical protein POM88_020374 [Heracleum sosnowskyi]KAK1382643.1 hypothetical protein POM88_020378 [Heracleum sosnowskyi]